MRTVSISSLFALIVILLVTPVALLAQDGDPATTEACFDCHDTETIDGHELAFDIQMGESVHDGFDCVDCHATIEELPHDDELPKVVCGDCHSDEAEIYTKHGRVLVAEGKDIPSCADCHGRHGILPSTEENSPVHVGNLPATCGRCHQDIDLTTKHELFYGQSIDTYQGSVHGLATAEGDIEAASCNDCHSSGATAHKIFGPGDQESTINHFNIPSTCGKCHAEVEQEFWSGIHGKLVARGETKSPVCTSCHGEHGIISPSDPRSKVNATHVAEATCGPCHESESRSQAFANDEEQHTWIDSYHGLKSQSGDISVANCASCHGTHGILPQHDPLSSVHTDNLQATCGSCHPGITATLANTPIHEDPGVSRSKLASLIKSVYIVLIILVIGGMLVHWMIDFRKQLRLHSKGPKFRRMQTNEVWQHWLLMLTFIALVITGFSLRYAESWWAVLLFGREGGFPMRGTIHRFAAVAFTATSLWHVVYLITDRGRRFLKDMLPTLLDAKQVIQMLSFNLGIIKERPQFARFSYVEKAEYWALVWGTIVMVATGLFLWFENYAIQWFSSTVLDIMLVVHYYEAWLATLAILVWHSYSTVLSPDVYPMNTAWISGQMPLKMYEHEHPADPALAPAPTEGTKTPDNGDDLASHSTEAESKDIESENNREPHQPV